MALANLGQWFYQAGLRVIIVDWDLEAPGLENFFFDSTKQIDKVRSRLGLIDVLGAYKREYPFLSRIDETPTALSADASTDAPNDVSNDARVAEPRVLDDASFLKRLQSLPPLSDTWIQVRPDPVPSGADSPNDKAVLRMISAGWRAGDRFADYAREVQNFNWSDFYQSYRGKLYFEWFRNQLESDNDVVLIDSRTGVTEMSGVCTQDLSDVVVSFCVPNVQNLTGVAQMARAFVREELKAARSPRPLPSLAIVPTRIENSEDDLRTAFKEEFFAALRDLQEVDKERFIDPESAWRMRIPYIPKYAYAEKLAVGAADGNEDLIEAYSKVGAYLTSLALADEKWLAKTERAVQERLRLAVAPALETLRPRSVLLSFSHREGNDLARRIKELLERLDIPVWSVDELGASTTDVRQQITSALSQSSFLLMIITKDFSKSEWARWEWRIARQLGICVYALKGQPDLPFAKLPRWLRGVQIYDIGIDSSLGTGPHWNRLVQELSGPCRASRIPFAVDNLPQGFIARPAELEQIISNLVDQSQDSIPGVLALRGPGGGGKTSLAIAACHDPRVQDAFDDGIVWITLGSNPGDLKARVEDLTLVIKGERSPARDLESASYQLAEVLSERRLLLVIDSVWSQAQLKPFLQGGPQCTRLITTRNYDVIPSGARVVSLGAMKQDEALAVLSSGLQPSGERGLGDLADRVGRLPLALHLLNRVLHHRVNETSQPLPDALSYVSKALDRRGLTFFDSRAQSEQQTISTVLTESLNLLSDDERERYYELAVFPSATDIPLSTVSRFWGRTANIDEFDTEELCSSFNRRSLLEEFDAGKRLIRVHPLIRDYLVQMQPNRLSDLHGRLLDAHRPTAESAPARAGLTKFEDGWAGLPDDEPYLWDHLAYHLVGAGLGNELVATVFSSPYLAVKTLLRGTLEVERDLSVAEAQSSNNETLKSLRKRYIQTSHILSRAQDLNDIAATLLCRFSDLSELEGFTRALQSRLAGPYLAPMRTLPDLPTSSLVRAFVGHTRGVNGCAFSPDGAMLASASSDNSLRLWDCATGRELAKLSLHADAVNACAFSPDGSFIASASSDSRLIVWDVATKTRRLELSGHVGPVVDCAVFPDGQRIVSVGDDGFLITWDAATGDKLITTPFKDPLTGCSVSEDGKLVACSTKDGAVCVLSVGTEQQTQTTPGRSPANDCAINSTTGALIGAFDDSSIGIWSITRDPLSLDAERRVRSQGGRIRSCAINSAGTQIVTGGTDHLIRIWDENGPRMNSTLRGHSAWINDCALSPDEKTLATASNDHSLRLWDLTAKSDANVPESHTLWTRRCGISADGSLLVTGSDDKKVRVWDTRTGAILSTLGGHKGWVRDCAISQDGSTIVSASSDQTVAVWDVATGKRRLTLKPSNAKVNSCAITPDKTRVISGSEDGTLCVWDAVGGVELWSFKAGSSAAVTRCVIDRESKYVFSAWSDNSLRVFDLETARTFDVEKPISRSLTGPRAAPYDCAISADGTFAIAASADGTLIVWNTDRWSRRLTLTGHTQSVMGCAISPDNKLIASVSRDSTLKIWDVTDGKCLSTFYSDGPLFGCVWFPDGDQLAAVGAAGGVYFIKYVRSASSDAQEGPESSRLVVMRPLTIRTETPSSPTPRTSGSRSK
jgi:WD40 repeat protein